MTTCKISRITTARPMTSKMSLLKILKLQLYHHAECIELVSAPAYHAARPSAHADFVLFFCVFVNSSHSNVLFVIIQYYTFAMLIEIRRAKLGVERWPHSKFASVVASN